MNLTTLIKLAWRNVWRSKYRSMVVIAAIMLGLWAGVFVMAFSWGMYDQRIREAIGNEISHFQIHAPKFQDDYRVQYTINDEAKVLQQLDNDPEVQSYSSRLKVSGMVASAQTSLGVLIIGINPEQEHNTTHLDDKIIDGTYFEDGKRNSIIIGQKLADKLKVKVRSKVVLTFQDVNGEITAGAFRVAGIFKTTNARFDEGQVFVQRADIGKLLGKLGGPHEIAVLLHNAENLDTEVQQYQADYPNLLVQGWKDIAPELGFAIDSLDQFMLIFIGIIMIGLMFSIVNTMLMAVLERGKELGMLMAIGMNKPRVFFMILFESIALSMVGGPVGLLVGYLTVKYFGHVGIDLSAFSEGFDSLGFSSFVYLRLAPGYYFEMLAIVIGVAIFSSLYPAYRALRLDPVAAIRKL